MEKHVDMEYASIDDADMADGKATTNAECSGLGQEDDANMEVENTELIAEINPSSNTVGYSNAEILKRIDELEKLVLVPDALDSIMCSELLMCHLMMRDIRKAKICRIRSNSQLPQVVISLSIHLERREFNETLRILNSDSFPEGLSETVEELRKRTVLTVLKIIKQCYTRITPQRMANMLCLNTEDELKSVLDDVKWSIDGDGGIVIQETPELCAKLEHIANDFTPASATARVNARFPPTADSSSSNLFQDLERILKYAHSVNNS